MKTIVMTVYETYMRTDGVKEISINIVNDVLSVTYRAWNYTLLHYEGIAAISIYVFSETK